MLYVGFFSTMCLLIVIFLEIKMFVISVGAHFMPAVDTLDSYIVWSCLLFHFLLELGCETEIQVVKQMKGAFLQQWTSG